MDPSLLPAVPIVVLIVLVLGCIIYGLTSVARGRKGPKFDGPALTGTAQVLSVQPTFSLGSYTRMWCRIGLRVEIPGYPPYDVSVKTPVPNTQVWAHALDGRTVAVQVDSLNLQKVRVDLSQPMPQAGWVGWPGTAPGGIGYGGQPPVKVSHPGPPYAQQMRGADLPPPLQPANAAPETGGGGRKPARIGAAIVQIFAVVCVLAGLRLILQGALPEILDSLGTPTRATVVHCVPHEVENNGRKEVEGYDCDGTWSVGGVSQTGRFNGRFHSDRWVGSQVDVRVRGGAAYKPEASLARDMWFIAGGFVAIATGVVLYWSARRKIKTGSWLWSGRRYESD